MADIFISYARDDRSRAELLADSLEHQGWTVWWDRNLLPGGLIDHAIETELNAAKSVIVLWSRQSESSKYVKAEAHRGNDRNILIPVRIDHTDPPFPFSGIHTADLSTWEGNSDDQEFISIVQQVRNMVGKPSHHGILTCEINSNDNITNNVHVDLEQDIIRYDGVYVADKTPSLTTLRMFDSYFFEDVKSAIMRFTMMALTFTFSEFIPRKFEFPRYLRFIPTVSSSRRSGQSSERPTPDYFGNQRPSMHLLKLPDQRTNERSTGTGHGGLSDHGIVYMSSNLDVIQRYIEQLDHDEEKLVIEAQFGFVSDTSSYRNFPKLKIHVKYERLLGHRQELIILGDVYSNKIILEINSKPIEFLFINDSRFC